ncbi:AAA family ATPase [Roseibium sp. RKSG952]|uniref:AAA family ATPase n=1 Tax=Roseibium sp. RKSG952 TaxID=2529384 RepID=UPI0012BB9561|nr:AAA family ATPase [Roseibium sp. RKSG952]MTH97110.1 hypothetical protein [Roseibium sp. RKSG952]
MEGTKGQPELSLGAKSGPENSAKIYWSQVHKLAFERLRFAATSRAPLTIFGGRSGTGRTRLVQELIAANPPGFTIAAILDPQHLTGDVHSDVLSAFDPKRTCSDDIESNQNELTSLLGSLHAAQRFPVLVVDDADQLTDTYLGNLCSMCDESAGTRPKLKLVLVGSTNLADILSNTQPDLTGPAFMLEVMSEEDVGGYARANLVALGFSDLGLTDDAVREMFLQTNGIPAKINIICDGIRHFMDERNLTEIDRESIRKIAADIRSNKPGKLVEDEPPSNGLSPLAPAGLGAQAIAHHAGTDAQFSTKAGFSQPHDTQGITRFFGRNTAVVIGLLGLATVTTAAYLLMSASGFDEYRSSLIGESEATPQNLPGINPAGNSVEVGGDIQKAIEAQARVTRLSDVIAEVDPSASGLYQAALRLAGTDADAAVASYARAALAGHDRSAYYLGQIYETGEGVPVDLALARAWYKMAASEIGGAVDRLNDLQSNYESGALTEPTQLFSNLSADGVAEFVWTSGEGPDPSTYRIEVASPEGSVILDVPDLELSAVRLMVPTDAQQWRVAAIDEHGGQEAVSPWVDISTN